MPEGARVPVHHFGEVRLLALVDEADLSLVSAHHWRYLRGYAITAAAGRTIFMHRLITGAPKGMQCDHINRDRADNRRANLRVVTHAQNGQNMPAIGGSSPHRGVSWHKGRQKWRADAVVAGKQHWLGMFDSELEAARVASEFRARHMPFSEDAML
jgi:hypothetical protein